MIPQFTSLRFSIHHLIVSSSFTIRQDTASSTNKLILQLSSYFTYYKVFIKLIFSEEYIILCDEFNKTFTTVFITSSGPPSDWRPRHRRTWRNRSLSGDGLYCGWCWFVVYLEIKQGLKILCQDSSRHAPKYIRLRREKNHSVWSNEVYQDLQKMCLTILLRKPYIAHSISQRCLGVLVVLHFWHGTRFSSRGLRW